jgi:16S rRNA (guanine527-N7)-methyltransferase
MEQIHRYFPLLNEDQLQKIAAMAPLYSEWNRKINVISRKDMDSLYEKHVLHSLAIAHHFSFKAGSRILDIGTGGGFPGIPLAVFFPEVQFVLSDSIGKKIQVVEQVAKALELDNVKTFYGRAENIREKFDFIVSRAVAPMTELAEWSKGKLLSRSSNDFSNGFILLKGGDLKEEIGTFRRNFPQYKAEEHKISGIFNEDFFLTKKIVYAYPG